jgi:hypothetical protein
MTPAHEQLGEPPNLGVIAEVTDYLEELRSLVTRISMAYDDAYHSASKPTMTMREHLTTVDKSQLLMDGSFYLLTQDFYFAGHRFESLARNGASASDEAYQEFRGARNRLLAAITASGRAMRGLTPIDTDPN